MWHFCHACIEENVHAHVGIWTSMCICTHVEAWGPYTFFRYHPSLTWNVLIRLDLVASKSQGSSCLCPQRYWDDEYSVTMLTCFDMGSGNETHILTCAEQAFHWLSHSPLPILHGRTPKLLPPYLIIYVDNPFRQSATSWWMLWERHRIERR